jgi:thiamine pyrophosphokinase
MSVHRQMRGQAKAAKLAMATDDDVSDLTSCSLEILNRARARRTFESGFTGRLDQVLVSINTVPT